MKKHVSRKQRYDLPLRPFELAECERAAVAQQPTAASQALHLSYSCYCCCYCCCCYAHCWCWPCACATQSAIRHASAGATNRERLNRARSHATPNAARASDHDLALYRSTLRTRQTKEPVKVYIRSNKGMRKRRYLRVLIDAGSSACAWHGSGATRHPTPLPSHRCSQSQRHLSRCRQDYSLLRSLLRLHAHHCYCQCLPVRAHSKWQHLTQHYSAH